MITTTPSPIDARLRRKRAGFTLVEIIIGSTISMFVLAGVLSTFVFLGRSGVIMQHYNDMEAQARKSLEVFAEDARQASSITWTDSNTLTLTVNNLPVVYGYVSEKRLFYRTFNGATRSLVTGVTQFEFKAYSITGNVLALGTDPALSAGAKATQLTTAGQSTKQLQISLLAARFMDFQSQEKNIGASNTVLSARFILRNKRVTA